MTNDGTGGGNGRDRRMAIVQIVVGVLMAAGLVVAAGLLYDWRLAVLLMIMMIPAVLATIVIHRHPERTGGRSAFGITDASTLLEPFTAIRRAVAEEDASDTADSEQDRTSRKVTTSHAD